MWFILHAKAITRTWYVGTIFRVLYKCWVTSKVRKSLTYSRTLTRVTSGLPKVCHTSSRRVVFRRMSDEWVLQHNLLLDPVMLSWSCYFMPRMQDSVTSIWAQVNAPLFCLVTDCLDFFRCGDCCWWIYTLFLFSRVYLETINVPIYFLMPRVYECPLKPLRVRKTRQLR